MIRVCVDTSFLISLSNPDVRENHKVACEYFYYCVEKGYPMFLSTIVAAEYEVRQRISDLPLDNFIILPFNARHAVKSAELARLRKKNQSEVEEDAARSVVLNDLKILGQATVENCDIILTEDHNTMAKWAANFREAGECSFHVMCLKEGFRPLEMEDPDSPELGV